MFDGIDACPNSGLNTILPFRMSHHEFVRPACHLYGSAHLSSLSSCTLKSLMGSEMPPVAISFIQSEPYLMSCRTAAETPSTVSARLGRGGKAWSSPERRRLHVRLQPK